jgi:hypothetical protein
MRGESLLFYSLFHHIYHTKANHKVYIDGGCRRGTDVVKALCLGAKGVGMGRPFLYSLTYGPEGVVHAIESESSMSVISSNSLRVSSATVIWHGLDESLSSYRSGLISI